MTGAQRLLNGKLSASDIGGGAILLEIGAEYGVIEPLQRGEAVDAGDAATRLGVPREVMRRYLGTLERLGLVTEAGNGPDRRVRATSKLGELVHEVGYITWGFRACEPLIAHAREFATDMGKAQGRYLRDGGLIARAAQWMGENGFYPQTERSILARKPKRIVDIGCGSGRLLVKCLTQLPDATAIGIDLNPKACAQARAAAASAGVENRLTILERAEESLADDPQPLIGADVIHAAWALHDLLPDAEATLDRLLTMCATAAPHPTLVIGEAVPYAQGSEEAMFSAAFSFLHENFMGRQFLTEAAWQAKLQKAGFTRIEVEKFVWPGGRLYTATR
jgi:SAM-dependent methyltransferase